jgi:hypothetical protein
MPRAITTASATIRISRARETGPGRATTCLVQSLGVRPIAKAPSWPLQSAEALQEHLPESDIPAPRLTVSDRDPPVVWLVWALLPERALWPVIRRLGAALEFYVPA